MRTVRNTVDTGRTVVCTIHQPSIDIFDAFDELLLLKRGGEEIYVGPLGRHCSQLIRYFETINGVQRIREGYNPATWMLEITSEAQERALGIDFAEVYRNSELYRKKRRGSSSPLDCRCFTGKTEERDGGRRCRCCSPSADDTPPPVRCCRK
nr:pleiotropic drug resistance protein 1-like [Ipomoea batatas]